MSDPEQIRQRLLHVQARIATAALVAGRRAEDVTLVAVSKTHPPEAIRAAYEVGQRDFGENYAQELAKKREALADLRDLRWHFIGALQSNKAKLLVPGCAMVHAIDRTSGAEALGKRAVANGITIDVLLEVNVGGEETKAGVAYEEAPERAREIAAIPGVRLRGLMSIPPPTEEEQTARAAFQRLRTMRDSLRATMPSIELLSMGMSGDYPWAIAEGATHVRVGTAIFGERLGR